MPQKEERVYLSPDEIAEEISISSQTILRWLKDGDLVGYKFARAWRVKREDLDKFLESRRNV